MAAGGNRGVQARAFAGGVNVIIRRADLTDYEPVCSLLTEVDQLHHRAHPQVFRPPGKCARSRAFYNKHLSSRTIVLLVVEMDGQLVGVALVFTGKPRPMPFMIPRRFAVLGELVVARTHRRRGIGRVLLRAAEEWAKRRGLKTLELNVWEFNQPAMAFYRKTGFVTASRRMWKPVM